MEQFWGYWGMSGLPEGWDADLNVHPIQEEEVRVLVDKKSHKVEFIDESEEHVTIVVRPQEG